jgi:hypothetical protein
MGAFHAVLVGLGVGVAENDAIVGLIADRIYQRPSLATYPNRDHPGLIRAGLATAQRENIKADSQSVGRLRITEAGRRALEG